MKVHIGPYKNWIGPYQIAEKLFFWKDKNKLNEENPSDVHPDHDAIHNLGDIIANIPGVLKFCEWVKSKRKRVVKIHIDDYDVWNMDFTLAMIIVPMLRKLKENKHGSPYIDDDDVPEELKSTSVPALSEQQIDCGEVDDNHSKRWEWVLDEMIWTFEQHSNEDWDDQYYKKVGDNFTDYEIDNVGKQAHLDRMEKGRMLFAKYYTCLWD